MKVYWLQMKVGIRLILDTEGEGKVEEIGGVRQTKSGFDAFARTFSYEPSRAQRGIATLEEAKTFVESFTPWDLYQGTEGVTVEPEVRKAEG